MDNSLKIIRKRILLKGAILIVILLLTLIVWNHSKGLDCSQCIVKFTQTKALGTKLDSPKVLEFSILELRDHFQSEEKCLVFWDKQNGYYILH
jgi:hypothetical protein